MKANMRKAGKDKIAYLRPLDISEQDCNPRERGRPPPLLLVLGRRISQAYLAALKELNVYNGCFVTLMSHFEM